MDTHTHTSSHIHTHLYIHTRVLIQENGIRLDLYGLNDQDLTFIKECIAGTPPGQRRGGREGACLRACVRA